MTEKKEVRFVSPKYRNLSIVVKEAIKKEVNGKIIIDPGIIAKFEDGQYITSDTEVIKFLTNHPNYGTVFTKGVDADASAEEKKAEENELKDKVKTLEERNAELEAKLKEKETKEKKTDNEKPLTNDELKAALKEKGLSTKGNKAELTKRLAEAGNEEGGSTPQFD